MAPPMPADMSTPRDEVELASVFWWVFGVLVLIGTVVGFFTDAVVAYVMGDLVVAAIVGGVVTGIVWIVRRTRSA